MTVVIDPYHKQLLRNLLNQVKQAVSEREFELAYELCDDIQAVFCAVRPETYEQRAPSWLPVRTPPDAA